MTPDTRQERIEAVRRACVRANPEIVELKFGCDIVDENKHRYTFLHFSPMQLAAMDFTTANVFDGEVVRGITFRISKTKIIGRPVRLADVLLAIEKKDAGYGEEEWMLNRMMFGSDKWNLLKDMEDQSDETLEFISRMLNDK